MENLFRNIIFVLFGLLFVAGCNKMEDDYGYDDIVRNSVIRPLCMVENNGRDGYSSGEIGTKALIDQTTNTDTILCNFLRLDEGEEAGVFEGGWGKAYLSEGTIATVADNKTNLREISLHPVQPYNSTQSPKKSRMIGWYPRTADVPQTAQGNDVSIQLENFTSVYHKDNNNRSCVVFAGLDGSKDLMVSDLREGSYSNPFDSDNFFKFKHYLSAIRVYAKADRSAQDIGMWGEISEVVIMNQPTTCTVILPETIVSGTGETYGEVNWPLENNGKFKIQKNHMFGEKDTDYPSNMKAEEYPIKLDGSGTEKFLGYSLVKPNHDLKIQIHTTAGLYNVIVPYMYGDPKTPIFNAGYIYDIHLNFKTDGTIFAFIENEGNEKYFDLSTGQEYNSDGQAVYQYKHSNCYIVESGPYNNDKIMYDGYCFDATVVGNGQGGIITAGSQTLYPLNASIEPKSADVLWQSSPRLISQVELIFGHVRFKVAKSDENNYKKGNAVIAVYDDNRNILWSWHIWITDTPQELSYQEDSTKITIMDRNLGATFGGIPNDDDDTQALETYGLYYQWGRKDPSMGPPTWDYSPINMTTAPYYDYSSEKKDAAEVMRLAAPTLKDAVENPMYLILPTTLTQTYYFNWLYEKIDFLWGYSKTSGFTHKSIYDPCPYGWRVPGGELKDLFTYASEPVNYVSINNGKYGQTVSVPKVSTNTSDKQQFFFPYAGFKGVDRGLNSLISSWKYVGKKGDYQSSIVSMYTEDDEYYMHRTRIYLSKDRTWDELNVGSYTGHQILDHTNRRTAAPVRCLKNEDHMRLNAFITPDKYNIASSSESVTFKLHAQSFGSYIESAILYVAYHLKENENEHKEYVVASWPSIGESINSQLWEKTYTFNFNSLKNGNASLNVFNTTGEIRFILRVKSKDHINSMSSTTTKVQSNEIEFLNWADEETFFANTEIQKNFRVYGDSEPTGVKIFQKGSNSSDDTELLGITFTKGSNLGGDYKYNFQYSMKGLKYSDPGKYTIYLKITLANGQELISQDKKFIIAPSAWEEVTNIDQEGTYEYLIMNVNSDMFAYDNGTYLNVKAVSDATCLFEIVKSEDNKYTIKNKNTNNYVRREKYELKADINEPEIKTNSDSYFYINYISGTQSSQGYFEITIKNRTTTYYWQQTDGNSIININSSSSNTRPTILRWKIFRKPVS